MRREKAVDVIVNLVDLFAEKKKYGEVTYYYSNNLDALEDAFEWLIEYGYAEGCAYSITLTEKFRLRKI